RSLIRRSRSFAVRLRCSSAGSWMSRRSSCCKRSVAADSLATSPGMTLAAANCPAAGFVILYGDGTEGAVSELFSPQGVGNGIQSGYLSGRYAWVAVAGWVEGQPAQVF